MTDTESMKNDVIRGAQYIGDLRAQHPDVVFHLNGAYLDWEDLKGETRFAKEMYYDWTIEGSEGSFPEWLRDKLVKSMVPLETYISEYMGTKDETTVKNLTSKCVSIIAFGSPWCQVCSFLKKQKYRYDAGMTEAHSDNYR